MDAEAQAEEADMRAEAAAEAAEHAQAALRLAQSSQAAAAARAQALEQERDTLNVALQVWGAKLCIPDMRRL